MEIEPLWNIEDVATYLGIPKATLYQWRSYGRGPKAFRLGKHVRYRPTDVEMWLERQS